MQTCNEGHVLCHHAACCDSQRDLDPAEQLDASVLVAEADMLQHRVGAAPGGRGDSSMLHHRSREARLGSVSSQQHRCGGGRGSARPIGIAAGPVNL